MSETRPVYVIDGARTPFLKAKGKTGPFSAADLAVAAARPVLARMPFTPEDIDEVIVGCVIPSPDEANIARIISLRLGCGKKVPAYTVQRNCASGMQALASARERITLGYSDLILAGGTEAMSRAPIQWNTAMVNWLAGLMGARTPLAKLKAIFSLRPVLLKPVITLIHGLSDPLVKLSMGQTAEIVADRFKISRAEQDAYAIQSHQRLAAAFDSGDMKDEIQVLYDSNGKHYMEDTGMRRDSKIEKLATLRPVFDRKYGSVTSANSSQITDGSAMLILASEDAVKKYDLPVLGEIIDHEWAGVDPAQMGLGPVHAVAELLKRQKMTMQDIDLMELNEAFAAQVIGCQRAWDSVDYARDELGMDKPLGAMDASKLNAQGGAVACGHPVGATGARLVLHILHALRRQGGGRGVATLCIGGGQGGAMLVRASKEAGGKELNS